jgi:hypothetical protein
MAEAIGAVLDEGRVLICEAGTGTGKTFAYLVPALLSGRKVLVSTGTKNLQDQLFRRDLPLIRELLDIPVRIALLKGRANYLCRYRLELALHDERQPPDLRRQVVAGARLGRRHPQRRRGGAQPAGGRPGLAGGDQHQRQLPRPKLPGVEPLPPGGGPPPGPGGGPGRHQPPPAVRGPCPARRGLRRDPPRGGLLHRRRGPPAAGGRWGLLRHGREQPPAPGPRPRHRDRIPPRGRRRAGAAGPGRGPAPSHPGSAREPGRGPAPGPLAGDRGRPRRLRGPDGGAGPPGRPAVRPQGPRGARQGPRRLPGSGRRAGPAHRLPDRGGRAPGRSAGTRPRARASGCTAPR